MLSNIKFSLPNRANFFFVVLKVNSNLKTIDIYHVIQHFLIQISKINLIIDINLGQNLYSTLRFSAISVIARCLFLSLISKKKLYWGIEDMHLTVWGVFFSISDVFCRKYSFFILEWLCEVWRVPRTRILVSFNYVIIETDTKNKWWDPTKLHKD